MTHPGLGRGLIRPGDVELVRLSPTRSISARGGQAPPIAIDRVAIDGLTPSLSPPRRGRA
jgi:hypothetical protein